MSFSSQDPIFEQLIPLILKWEGGAKVTNNPKDPGGKTKYGISTNANNGVLRKLGVTDVKDLTEDQAKRIYFEEYYTKSGAHEIEDNGLCLIHFDAAVNHGVGAAKSMLAELSRNPDHYQGSGLNKGLFNALAVEYIGLRVHRYAADKNADTFLEGWCNRIARLCAAHKELQLHPEHALT